VSHQFADSIKVNAKEIKKKTQLSDYNPISFEKQHFGFFLFRLVYYRFSTVV